MESQLASAIGVSVSYAVDIRASDVREIRRRSRQGLGTQLAKTFGVSPSTVMLIVRGRMRRTAGGSVIPVRTRRKRNRELTT